MSQWQKESKSKFQYSFSWRIRWNNQAYLDTFWNSSSLRYLENSIIQNICNLKIIWGQTKFMTALCFDWKWWGARRESRNLMDCCCTMYSADQTSHSALPYFQNHATYSTSTVYIMGQKALSFFYLVVHSFPSWLV